jgi:hypothetical protein
MRLGLGGKPRLWSVLVLTVVAAIALVAGISNQSSMPHAKEMSAAER